MVFTKKLEVFSFVLLLLLMLLTLSHNFQFVSAKVIELTDDDFEGRTQAASGGTSGDHFIKFYAPWCGFCQRLAPVWDDLGDLLAGEIVVAKVNVDENTQLSGRFGIKSLPTLIFIRQGKMYRYSGQRTIESLEEFAKGGYAKENAENVPGEPTLWQKILAIVLKYGAIADQEILKLWKQFQSQPYSKILMQDFDHLYKFRKLSVGIVLGLGVAIGLILMSLCWCCCGVSNSQPHRRSVPPSNQLPKAVPKPGNENNLGKNKKE